MHMHPGSVDLLLHSFLAHDVTPKILMPFFLWYLLSATKLDGLKASKMITVQKGMKWNKGINWKDCPNLPCICSCAVPVLF